MVSNLTVSNIVLFESNIIKLAFTFSIGLFLSVMPYQVIIKKIFFFILFVGIAISFLFNVGEVYIYGENYKRAFFYFSDEITTVLALGWLLFVTKGWVKLSIITALAVFLSGGKISILLITFTFLLCFIFLEFFKEYKTYLLLLSSILCGLIGYVSSVNLANNIEKNNISMRPLLLKIFPKKEVEKVMKVSGRASCQGALSCIKLNLVASFKQRYFTSLAGIWMISKGGFSGKQYPNTPDKFAALMVENNPFGINTKYGLTYNHWKKMGGVQSPFIDFGAGYGPSILCVLILCFGFVAYCAISNLRFAEDRTILVFSLYFLVIFFLNHTQSWLKSGSAVLIMMGYLTGYILISWYKRTQPFNSSESIA
ncbi:MAG: hypothetical protein ABJN57_06280 [Hyphomicrobiales bacterium]